MDGVIERLKEKLRLSKLEAGEVRKEMREKLDAVEKKVDTEQKLLDDAKDLQRAMYKGERRRKTEE